MKPEQRLGVSGWTALVRGLVAQGVRRVRITGGEPLLHPQLLEVVGAIANIDGVEDLALTTNGTRLAERALALRKAGLQRLNVSIDSLVPERFERMTRGGKLSSVLRGIERAAAAGFKELKTNTVVVAGENDDELLALTGWAWSLGMTPRFLELMAIGEGARLRDRVVSFQSMHASLAPVLADAPGRREPERGPAIYFASRRGRHRVGFITGSSDTFCEGCDRLRATSDGRLRSCLASNRSVSVADAARSYDLAQIGHGLAQAWAEKPDGSAWHGCNEEGAAAVSMRASGG